MGNIPIKQRLQEQDVVAVVHRAREERRSIVRELMDHFGLAEHQAKYHYSKVVKKGLVTPRREGHAPRVAIMFLNSPREERIELCQECKMPWPCNAEVLRRQHESEEVAQEQTHEEDAALAQGDVDAAPAHFEPVQG